MIDAVAAAAEADAEAAADLAALGAGGPCAYPPALLARFGAERPAVVRAAAGADRVPAQWADALGSMSAVSVPGPFARAALERSGVPAERLHVAPPVVDAARFTPSGPARRAQDAGGFVFMAVLDWTRASGWDVLVRAYAEEFDAEEDVSLVIRAWSSLGYTPDVVGQTLLLELQELGHDPGDLADLILELEPSHAALAPELYRGADCVVAPARADAWGRRILEAMACGVPVIATDWAAGGELLAPGAGLAVPAAAAPVTAAGARERPDLDGARWGEPDVAALRRHMRTLFDDRERAAELGARGREHVLAHHAGVPSLDVPRAERRRVTRSTEGAHPSDVSFVLQGPIERGGRGSTAAACASIRASFPGAEIVVSTWEGSDTSGLDHDTLVISSDPGGFGGHPFNANTNRQIVSSLAGVQGASRPLVVKVRSDIQFLSGALLTHWRRWEERSDELRLFEHRVLVPNVFTRRPTHLSPYPLHPSDWCYFGTREDLELLFDVPHMRARDSRTTVSSDALRDLWYTAGEVPTYTPEQWIFTQALKKADSRTTLRHVFDLSPKSVRLTELAFANNLAILDTYRQYGIWCPKYAWPNRLFEDFSLFQHDQWLELYEALCCGTRGDEDAAERLAGLAAGTDGATRADAAALRRAGHGWEAQLLECVLAGHRLNRDTTTGGHARWMLDERAVLLARTDLQRAVEAAPAATLA